MPSFLRLIAIVLALSFWGADTSLYASAPRATLEQVALQLAIAEEIPPKEPFYGFYRDRGYAPLWIGNDPQSFERRVALFKALARAGAHGLPAERYRAAAAKAHLGSATSKAARAKTDIALTRLFLKYAQDIQFGILEPSKIDAIIGHKKQHLNTQKTLTLLAQTPAALFFRNLMPQSPEYGAFLKEKARLEQVLEKGGWGADVPAEKYVFGKSRDSVILLRERLIAMGFLERSAARHYDQAIRAAVYEFQKAHGLTADGIVGENTIIALNTSAEEHLGQLIVALERQRWMNRPLGQLYIWVNLAAAKVSIIEDGTAYFTTRAVVGHPESTLQSAEFADEITHMIVNPTWNVPRSIVVNEYLPLLQEDLDTIRTIEIFDNEGTVIDRTLIAFEDFDEENFPYSMRQLPSLTNALGRVKFMFPNKYNIYLHDTPEKKLFYLPNRTFSHGCIRLHKPYEFSYALLALQTKRGVELFHEKLDTIEETRIDLARPVPIYLVYQTLTVKPGGDVIYRTDHYWRDAKVIAALRDSGVDIPEGAIRAPAPEPEAEETQA